MRNKTEKKVLKVAKSTSRIKRKIVEVDGIKFDSSMEADYYIKLKADKANNLIKNVWLQPEFILQEKFIVVEGKVVYGSDENFEKLKRKYKAKTISQIKLTADFLVEELDGRLVVKETKGVSTPEFELRKRLFLNKYPMYELEVLIYNSKTGTWDDYYQYNKEKRAAKRARKAAKDAKEKAKVSKTKKTSKK